MAKEMKSSFLLGLFLLPFVFWPRSVIPFEIPRIWFFQRWVEILGIFSIFKISTITKNKKVDNYLTLLVILFFGIVFAGSFFGINFSKSFWGNYYRGDGLLTLMHLIGLFLFLVLFWQTSWLKPITKTISLSSLLISFWTIFQGFDHYVLGNTSIYYMNNAVAASFGNPNFLAGFLLITLPLTTLSLNKPAVLLQIIAIFLTKSWSGIFGIIIFLAGWLIIQKRKKALPHLIILFIALFFTTFLFIKQKAIEKIPNHYVAESRERIFKKAFLAFQQRPVLGWGWANFDYAFKSIDWPMKFNNDVYVDKAHSNILEILVTTGIFGLITYLLVIFKTAKNFILSKNKYSKYFFLSLVLFVFHSQTNIISIAEETIFWLIAGIAAKT